MIGQGTVLASPMAMATVIASVQSGDDRAAAAGRGRGTSSRPDAPAARAAPRRRSCAAMLRGVVTSGSGSGLADVPAPPVIAKTGTAEFDDDGTILTHAWMIAAQGDLAVAVFVDDRRVRLRHRRPDPRGVPPRRLASRAWSTESTRS